MALNHLNLVKLVIASVLVLKIAETNSASLDEIPPFCTNEEHRPQYHFSPASNWMNDPNGMIYYDGTYHLFYQYHPSSSVWGPMHWGHAVSSNLVTWDELDVALEPDVNGDIFSGSAVPDSMNSTGFQTDDGIVPIVAIYTSAKGEDNNVQTQSLAFSNDKGATFEKYDGNPVLANENELNFRDPKVFFHQTSGKWVMSLAVGNKIEFYSSLNLKNWTKLSEFGNDPPVGNHDGVWECPDLFPVLVELNGGTKILELTVLLVSINPGGPNGGSATQYFIGNFTGTTFIPYTWQDTQWLDWGPDNYAGVTFADEPSGRKVYIGWMNNWAYANQVPTSSWRGQMTLPREIGLYALNSTRNQYLLTSMPAEEVQSLRNPSQYHEQVNSVTLPSQTGLSLTEQATFKTPLMELEITVEWENEPQFSICAYNSQSDEICFGYKDTNWFLDRSKSGNTVFNEGFSNMLVANATRVISTNVTIIRMFLDVSSIEVFADGGLTSMTALHYPKEPLDMLYIKHLSDAASGTTLTVQNFRIWGLLCQTKESSGGDGGVEDTTGSGASMIQVFNSFTGLIFVLMNFLYT